MKAFRFRLEKVLAWRRTEFEVEQYRTRQLAQELERIELARAKLAANRTAAEQTVVGAAVIQGADLASHAAYLERLNRLAEKLQRQRKEQEQRLSEQHQRLMEARRRVRLLERLRVRRQEEWQAEFNRELEDFAAESHLARWEPHKR
ncbi:MAG: hypothetical protein ACE141_00370 [Bryobacteraceae bacterium]